MAEFYISTDHSTGPVAPVQLVSPVWVWYYYNLVGLDSYEKSATWRLDFNERFKINFEVREHELTSAELVETVQIEDYSTPGPRRSEFSQRPEVRCMLLHSFKNCEMSSWRHNFDVLMATNLLPTDFMSTLRRAIAVSNLITVIAPCGV